LKMVYFLRQRVLEQMGPSVGEIVFNTSLTGYPEISQDPKFMQGQVW